MAKNNPRVFSIDLDGTLCQGDCYTKEEMLNAIPLKENIDLINKLFVKKFVVIDTARRKEYAVETMKWLDQNGVKYHAIHFEKMPCDVRCDDRSMDFKQLKQFI
jgi:uncharacterized HAD superfamily protein